MIVMIAPDARQARATVLVRLNSTSGRLSDARSRPGRSVERAREQDVQGPIGNRKREGSYATINKHCATCSTVANVRLLRERASPNRRPEDALRGDVAEHRPKCAAAIQT